LYESVVLIAATERRTAGCPRPLVRGILAERSCGMQRIELDDQTADILAAQASARGMSSAQYLKSLVPPATNGCADSLSLDELDSELGDLVLDLPTLPHDFSRADIYDEHD
jgi:hypothetical protein